ncbi:MAG: potassium-transporting ATPase, subunit [Bacteriovoracaceae bacterium]|nr:potassium-transporting ATPase, subunit [Bacteriovoracaceae bacterium]
MTTRDTIQLGLYLIVLILATKPLALHLEKVFEGSKNLLSPIFGPIEKLIYRLLGVNPDEDQHWTKYSIDLLVFSGVTCGFTYLLLRAQKFLPLNPQGFAGMTPDLAYNTAMSFTTNTNWQSYGGESTLSYLSQMLALTFHNFISAAVGIAVAVALIRGISKKEGKGIGNFWADMIRCNLYVLLPICIVYALFLISQGVIQNFHAYDIATTLEGVKQTIAQGPVASQVAIKMLGTNGGGFFNANAAHPYENPTALSNFFQMLSIFLIPSALVYLLGRRVRNKKHGWAVWAAMAIIFVVGVLITAHYEYQGNPKLAELGCSSPANMEGKEARFGIFNSAFFATITTDASCGAVNAMHDSFTPLGGAVPLSNIMLGEIIFGGVGSGLYGMLMYILLTVFIAGLMIGRTPEYVGKKIEGREIKYVMFAMIVMALSILGFTAWGALDPRGLAGLNNPAGHGFSEILYAYTSGTGNNGSAFAGLSANTPFWNWTLAFAMFFGRFFMMIPMLAVAGSLAKKKIHPGGEGTFRVDNSLFVGLLIGVILLVGALTFFPALSLGPIAEHFDMLQGHLFK